MKNSKKGFNLIELIVVITILAILGTITFISLRGQSLEANISRMESEERIRILKDKDCYKVLNRTLYICEYPTQNIKCEISLIKKYNYSCFKLDSNILTKKEICIELGGEEEFFPIGPNNCIFVKNKGSLNFEIQKVSYSHLKYIY